MKCYCNICGSKFKGENPAACPDCKKEIETRPSLYARLERERKRRATTKGGRS